LNIFGEKHFLLIAEAGGFLHCEAGGFERRAH